MPKEAVYRLECDRCGREWFPPAKEGEPTTATLLLELKGPDGKVIDEAHLETLCGECVKTITNYVAGITKDLKRPRRKRGKEELAKEEALEPPPTHRESIQPASKPPAVAPVRPPGASPPTPARTPGSPRPPGSPVGSAPGGAASGTSSVG